MATTRAAKGGRPDRGTAPPKPVLEARNLTRRYGELVAVDAVSFAVAPGEVVGLLGPNGAGKTTVMRVLTTMLAPSAGDFRLLGLGPDDATAIRERIGVFPENSSTPGAHTGRAEIEYHALLHGHPPASVKDVAQGLLVEVGLLGAADRPSRGYSRGMRQRLGIARALVSDPEVIFLDEPTLGLDPAGRRQVLRIIVDAASRRAAAVIVSTHLLDEVERVCDRVVVMDDGALVAEGTVEELRELSGLPSVMAVSVQGDLTHARAALEGAAAVCDVAEGASGSGELLATVDDSAGDAASEIVQALADAGIRTTSFALNPAGLEDVFLELTGSGE